MRVAFLALSEDGKVLLRKRPDKGLLGGMLEVPSSAWVEGKRVLSNALNGAPIDTDWWGVPGTVVHTFTHFRLEIAVYRAIVPAGAELTFWADPTRCRWVARRDLSKQALPSVMNKVIGHALKAV